MAETSEPQAESSQPGDGNERRQKLAEELKAIVDEKNVMEQPTANFSVDLAQQLEASRLDAAYREKIKLWADSERQRTAELPESEKPLHVAILDRIKQAGVAVAHEDEVMHFLAGADLVHSKKGEYRLAELIGSDAFTPEQALRLKELDIAGQLGALITERVRQEIGRMLPIDKVTDPENVSINTELSVPIDIDSIEEIRKIVSDPEFVAAQGVFQNVIVSKDSDYVLKMLKMGVRDKAYAKEDIRGVIDLKKAFGTEMVADQVALDLKEPDMTVILQEKLDMNTYQVLAAGKGVREVIALAKTSPENMAVLRHFLDGMARLETSTGGVLDMLGDNVYFSGDSKVPLNIKIIDPGCFHPDDGYEGATRNVRRVKDLIAILEVAIE